MRTLLLCAATTSVFTLASSEPLVAQAKAATSPQATAGAAAAGSSAAGNASAAGNVPAEGLAAAVAALQASHPGFRFPPAAAFTAGGRTVPAGASVAGAYVADGTLLVLGRVMGDAVSYRGDVVVREGGEVAGNAIAILGKVRLEGGRVAGDARAFAGDLRPTGAAGAQSPAGAVASALALAVGWLAIIALVGIGVLVFASPNLDAVSDALERDFSRAFLAGLAGQLAALPALVLLCVALALTILGTLLIPFAIVAYVLAAAGLLTLGYLAIARLAGKAIVGSATQGERERRAAALRALIAGLTLLMIPWLVAALLAWTPGGVLAARVAAVALSWVACTAGLGAALVSRGGVRRATAAAAQKAMSTASWQTPTPVAGVAAARRPTPIATSTVK